MSKVTISTLELVVNQKITIFDALKKYNSLKIIATYDYNSGKVTQEKIAFADISQEDLPKQDTYAFMMPSDIHDKLCLLCRLLITPIDNSEHNNREHNINVVATKDSHLEYSTIS